MSQQLPPWKQEWEKPPEAFTEAYNQEVTPLEILERRVEKLETAMRRIERMLLRLVHAAEAGMLVFDESTDKQ
ncbi:MAG: hypothetical protein JXR83_10185 [Deltaproteobacteria bacterium]|nr:hypothetical protein [Deltaproteobacteria bacterium]